MMLILFIILITNVRSYSEVDQLEEERIKILNDKYRCSRRFTPGVCADSVVSVWTFEFQIMNCTERLGCPQSHRTNRFSSYNACMKRCEPLINLYMQIFTYGGQNDTRFFLRDSQTPGKQIRRDSFVDVGVSISTRSDPGEQEYSGDESIMSSFMYGDNDNDRGGVDYMEDPRDSQDYFNFH